MTVQAAQAPPTIAGINPPRGSTRGGETLTITGQNFGATANVTLGGSPATNVVVSSSTTMTATAPAHTRGQVDVVVTTKCQTATLTNGYRYGLFDPNGDQLVTIDDVTYLSRFIFAGGPAPVDSGDANGDGVVNVLDIIYTINFLFGNGREPI